MGIPVVHLDRHHWTPGWTPTASKEWTTLQANLVAGERWVIDGSYGGNLRHTLRARRHRRRTRAVQIALPGLCGER